MRAFILLVVVSLLPVQQTQAASNCFAVAKSANVNIRSGPSAEEYSVIGVISNGEALPIIGQNESGDWYAVEYPHGEQAWVAGNAVELEGSCDLVPTLPNPGPPPEIDQLMSVPILPTLDVENLRAIYARGQALGNAPDAFTKLGDCNTDTSFFLTAFDTGAYDLGTYDQLQPTVDYFAGSFEHISLVGQVGFNAATMLDPMFVDPRKCASNEGGLLACEYDRRPPSVAILMFGPNDLLNLSEEQFAQAVTDIVEYSIDRGVIPVITTFTWHKDQLWPKALRFNVITVEIAEEYGIPVINFWRAAQDLPNMGLIDDYTHLTSPNSSFDIAFTGEETRYGYPMRNLLTLQTLDLLRREVIEAKH